MRMKGKKPIFGYKDTYDLNDTLRPIIGAGITKFIEVKKQKDEWFGVPGQFMNDIGVDDVNVAAPLWDEVLEKMRYAFCEPEPDMTDYDFEFGPITSEPYFDENGNKMYKMDPIEVFNRPAYEDYKKDEAEHHRRVQEGYELFGKYFNNLWW